MSAARDLADLAGDVTVASVVVAIGPDVDPGVAATAWRTAVERTSLVAASVTWQEGQNTLACFDCGLEYAGRELDRCPNCGGNGLIITQAPIVAIVDWRPAPPAPSPAPANLDQHDSRS